MSGDRPRICRPVITFAFLALLSPLPPIAYGNSYAGRLRSIEKPRFTGMRAILSMDTNPTVPADGSSSNFWIGLNAEAGGKVTNWVQVGWSRERTSSGNPVIVKRSYVEWNDNTLTAGAQHHLVFHSLPSGADAEYEVQLGYGPGGARWIWTAGEYLLEWTKLDGPWARTFCVAQAQAEMISDDSNVHAPGSASNKAYLGAIRTRVGRGAYESDTLGPNRTSGLKTGNVHIEDGTSYGFRVWDSRN